jgi:cold shock CspA family protein
MTRVGELVEGTVVGRVADFDEAAGYGHVVAADESGEWFFHCTAIVDGSRTVEVGATVAFEVEPGHRGRYEAVAIRPA